MQGFVDVFQRVTGKRKIIFEFALVRQVICNNFFNISVHKKVMVP